MGAGPNGAGAGETIAGMRAASGGAGGAEGICRDSVSIGRSQEGGGTANAANSREPIPAAYVA